MADAIVGVLFQNLNSLIQREFGLVWGVQAEMMKLSSTLSAIRAVLEDAEIQQIKSKAIQDWLSKLKDAAYDADDILDEWSTDQFLRLQPEADLSSKSCTNLLQAPKSFLDCFNFKQVGFRYKIAKKIKEIKEKFDEIAKEKSDFHLREVGLVEGVFTHTHLNQNRETSSVIKEPQIYGRDADREIIVKLLLENFNDENGVSVLPILGIGGLGKTTLAQFIYNDERVVNHFDDRIWVCVSDDFDVKRLLKAIIECSSKKHCDLDNLDPIQDQLQEILKGKKFLLVLDDVWNEKQDEWNLLKNSLTSGAKGSSIIITTRLQTVASIAGTAPVYKLQFLSEDDCCSLFRCYAFDSGNEEKPSLVTIGQEIVKKCGGVALAAKALGSLLRFKSEEKQWEFIRDSEIWNLEGGEETTILPALRLSYNNLSPHLRQCFAYCSLFPKDYEISKELLIHLWMANGLLQSDERLQPEEIGEAIFKELLLHSFFQEMKTDGYGNIRTCKIHDLLHDLASSVMKNDYSNVEGGKRNLNIQKKPRHLSVILPSFSESFDINDLGPSQQSIRTLLFLSIPFFSDSINFSMHHMSIISHLTCLRTLCLNGNNVKMLPSSIGDLKHLRYLNLDSCGIASLPESFCRLRNLQMLRMRGNNLVALPASILDLQHLRYLNLFYSQKLASLPESISKLKSLHTLILTHCSLLKELPKTVRNIGSLRRLDTHGCLGLTHMPFGIGSLTGLQTLSLFILSQARGSDGGIKELHRLNLLRGELEIDGLQHLRNSIDGKGANLMSKQYILELTLKWSDYGSDVRSSKEVLEGLQPHPNLKRLDILGYPGSEFPTWMEMGDPLSTFPRLITIELCGMHNLVEWSLNWKEHESLPSLQHLFVIDCKRLKALPTRLCNLRSLRTLNIQGCEKLLSLPHELGKLTSLDHLSIKGCNCLSSLPEMGMQGLKCSLKSLSINDCKKLSSMSKELRHLTSLKELFIQNCPQLEFSGQDFEHLISLQLLEIAQLSIAYLPESIKNMSKLQSLIIKECDKLIRWPNGMDKLTSLQFLEVEDCDYLRDLPECFKDVFINDPTLDSDDMWFQFRRVN